MWLSDFDLDQKILQALESGPKTVVAIRLFLHERENAWVSDYEIATSLSVLVAAGLCDAADLDVVSGLSTLDPSPRVGYAMLYSLAKKDGTVSP